uniref:Uncharacterized protein n=1 Tax=Vespula pensylvanica TaxID=30213 RepID=A0A834PFA1_VESPE|nr:hypothetical protein H0235_001050 [Vespula pensylvanica]
MLRVVSFLKWKRRSFSEEEEVKHGFLRILDKNIARASRALGTMNFLSVVGLTWVFELLPTLPSETNSVTKVPAAFKISSE